MPDGSINVKITADASGFIGGANQAGSATDQLAARLALTQSEMRAASSETAKLADQLRNAGSDSTLADSLTEAAGRLRNAREEVRSLNEELNKSKEGGAGGFAGGLNQVNEHLDHLKTPLTATIAGFRELAEVIGAAWAVEKIVETAREMGELGEKTVNTAAALGISARQFSLMSSGMAIAGGNSDTLVRTLTLLQAKLVQAVDDPASKARESLLAMGISVEQMKDGLNDLPGFLRLVADGFVHMGAGAGRVAAFREFGRMFKEIVPYIKDGAEGMDRYNAAAAHSRAPLSDEDVERLDQVGGKFNQIGQDILGLKEKIALGFHDPLIGILDVLDNIITRAGAVSTSLGAGLGAIVGGIAGGVLTGGNPLGIAAGAAIGAGGGSGIGAVAGNMGPMSPSGVTAQGVSITGEPALEPEIDRTNSSLWPHTKIEGVEPPAAPAAETEGARGREHEGGGEAKTAAPPPVNDTQERKKLEEAIKADTEALKKFNAERDLEIAKAKGRNDDVAIEAAEQRKLDELAASIKRRQALIDAAAAGARNRPGGQPNEELAKQYEQLGAGLPTEDLDAQKRAEELKQQINQRAYRDFAATEKQKVVEAKGDADAILAIYREWAEQAATVYHQPAPVITGINTEGIKAQQQAQEKQFKDAQDDVRAAEQQGRARISIDKAQNDILVAQHQESKAKALENEQQYTEQVLAEIVKRVQAEELANAKTPEERKKALEDLAKAEDDYATKVIEDQAKITAAVEAENAKQVETLKQGFDQIGSAFDSAFKGLIDGTQSATDKIVQTQHVAANGVVFFTSTVQHQSALANTAMKLLQSTGDAVANTMLKMGTQAAAKWLGEATGHKFGDDETPSLSGLLAKIVGPIFGLGDKEVPKDGGLKKAGDALTDAAKNLTDAANTLKGGAGAAGAAPGKGSAGAAGTADTGATGAGSTPGAPATGQYADTINAAAKQYNVPPQILYNLIGAESGFNPAAKGPPVKSRGGEQARGLGQFMPEEAKEYGVDVNDPTSSIQGAAHYMSDLYAKKGSWSGALGAYSGQGPSLSGYASQNNAYGPALVSAAQTADRGGTQMASASPTAGTTAQPVSVDIEQIAGSTLTAPAATSGGGLPVSPVAPPSTDGTTPAAPTPTLASGLAPPSGATPDLGTLGPQLEANTASLTNQSSAITTLSSTITSQQTSTTTDATNTQSNTTQVQDNTTAVKALTDKLGTASPGGASSSGTSSSDSSGLGVVNSLLGLAGPVSKLTGISAIGSDASAASGAIKAITQLGSVVGFAEGGPVDQTGLAMVHQGEFVVPADQAKTMRATIPSAAGGMIVDPATDTQGFWSSLLQWLGMPQQPSRYDQWGGDRSVPDKVADSLDPAMGGRNVFGLFDPGSTSDQIGSSGGLESAPGAVKALIHMTSGYPFPDTISPPTGDFTDTGSGDASTLDQASTDVPSGAGGMVVSGGPQFISPLGWTGGATVGSPTTLYDITGEVGPQVPVPNQVPPSSSNLLAFLTGGLGLAAGLAGLFVKWFGNSKSDSPGGAGGGPGLPNVGDVGSGGGGGISSWFTSLFGGGGGADAGGGDWWSSADAISAAAGAVIPSAAGGMKVDDGKGGTIAIVHPNEMVLPANLSKGIQQIIGAGGVGGDGIPSADDGMVVPGDSIGASSATTGSPNSTTTQFQQGTTNLAASATTLGTAGTSLLTAAQQLTRASSGGAGGGGVLGGLQQGLGILSSAISVGKFLAPLLALDEGSSEISQDGLAYVHKGEMVIPQTHAETLRSGGLSHMMGMMVNGSGPAPVDMSGLLEAKLPHFELGAWEISHDMAGYLHQGESVIPAGYANQLRAGAGGGSGGDVNLHYSPTVNAPAQPTLETYLHREGQTMLGWINAQMRSGALRPPPG